jgi:hypothetical protein
MKQLTRATLMKIRSLVAVGMTLLVTSAAGPNASAVSYNFGSRPVPASIAGGARYAAVVKYQPVGKSTSVSTYLCSTGVPWRLANGTRGFLTAGHCLPANNRTGAQVITTASKLPWTAGAPIGARSPSGTTVNASGTIAGAVGDLAFVPTKGHVGNYVFTGGPTSRSLAKITSWGSRTTPGYTLCFSGFTTGSRCGLKQGKVTSYQDGNRRFTGLAEVYLGLGSPSQRCSQGGDSGGVVYRVGPGGVAYVYGIISGSGRKATWALGCSLYYTPLAAATAKFGGGPIIS